MRCDKVQDIILTDYLDGRLTGVVKVDFDEHLAGCSKCRQFCTFAQSTLADPFPREHLPRSVANAVLDQLRSQEPVGHKVWLARILDGIQQWCSPSWPVVKAFAAIFICVLVAGNVVRMNNVQHVKQKEGILYLVQVAEIPVVNQKSIANYGTSMESYFLGERGDS